MAWERYIKITLDHTLITEDLTDFPLQINLSTESGLSSADISLIFAILGDNYLKIKLLDADLNEHYIEIKQWSAANSKAVLTAKIHLSSTEDSVYKLHYDASAVDNTAYVGVVGSTPGQNVYDTGFKAVYTMAQDPSVGGACILDSTVNANSGTPYGTMTSSDLVGGLIGKALDFDGSNDYVQVPDSASLDITEAITIEVFCYNNVSKNQGCVYKGNLNSWTNHAYALAPVPSSNVALMYIGSTPTGASSPCALQAWEYYAGVYDRSQIKSYTNSTPGTPVAYSPAIISNNYPLYIGFYYGTSYVFNGKIENIRISNVARSQAWIAATNKSLRDQLGTFQIPTYKVAGDVSDGTNPLETTVRALDLTGNILGETISSAIDGTFEIPGLITVTTVDEIDTIAYSLDGNSDNDLIFRVNPVLDEG